MSSLRTLVPAVVLLLCASCGYRFGAGGGGLPDGVTRVVSPVFHNNTAEPGLEVIFTRALREQLMRSGVRTAASGPAPELRGEVLAVWGGPTILTTPIRQGETPTLASYRIWASAKLRLVEGERVLAETDIVGSEDYLPGQDILDSERNRQAALHRLAERLMTDGFDRLSPRT